MSSTSRWKTKAAATTSARATALLVAQLALALNGQDRAQVLSQMLELLADRELRAAAGGSRQ